MHKINIEPHLKTVNYFLNMLDPAGFFTFQTFDESEKKDSSKAKVLHGTFAQHSNQLIQLNKNGAGVFVMVNEGDGICHDEAKTCRTSKNVIGVRALFVDLDGAPLEPALNYKLTPSIVIQTSTNRYHAYWLIDDCPLDQFKPLQQALAKQLNGDTAVCDLPRVMRLPGFYHMKGEPIMVKMIHPCVGV